MHWHPEYEIMFLLDGFLDFIVDSTLYHLRPNEALFINSNSIHGHADFWTGYGHYLCFSFGEDFLFPDTSSYIYERFFAPLHQGKLTFTRHITPACAWHPEILTLLNRLSTFGADIPGHALSIQICLLQIFEIMHRENAFNICHNAASGNELIQTALWYIKKNYTTPLTVNGISELLSLSPDYFCRLFKANTGF